MLVSIPSDDGAQCVDIFEEPDGMFGFQHFRSDAENLGGWTPIGTARRGHREVTTAAASAVVEVSWLSSHPRARQSLEDWLLSASSGL